MGLVELEHGGHAYKSPFWMWVTELDLKHHPLPGQPHGSHADINEHAHAHNTHILKFPYMYETHKYIHAFPHTFNAYKQHNWQLTMHMNMYL